MDTVKTLEANLSNSTFPSFIKGLFHSPPCSVDSRALFQVITDIFRLHLVNNGMRALSEKARYPAFLRKN